MNLKPRTLDIGHRTSDIHEVLVIGHHDPDTDAVYSAIAYASLYTWQTGNQAVPCHLDHLNRETAWLLKHVGIPSPRAIKDVFFRVSDVMRTDILEERSLVLVHDDNGLDLAANAFNKSVNTAGMIELPGVMSRKKQVVPFLAAAFNSG